MSFEPGGKWQISIGGGASPRWSADGRWLYYRAQDQLIAVAVETGATFRAEGREPRLALDGVLDWELAPDGERLLLVKAPLEHPRAISSTWSSVGARRSTVSSSLVEDNVCPMGLREAVETGRVTRPGSTAEDLSGLAAAAHLCALASFAVAQPLFGLLSHQAEFFVAHDVQPLDLLLIALLLSVLLPALLFLAARSAALFGRAAGRWAHLTVVAALSGLIALQVLEQLAPAAPGAILITGAVALAVASAGFYQRWSIVRTFLTFVAPAALFFPLFFLFTSPVRQMLLPRVADWSGGGEGGSGAPVVMVILDELPLVSLLDASFEVDTLRYPNFAALARDAYWFRDATTVAASTTLSVPIILSGRVPDRFVTPLAEHYPDNLFTWLGDAGYRLNAFEIHSRICPASLCSRNATRRGFTERFDAMATDLGIIYLHLLLPAEQAAPLTGDRRHLAQLRRPDARHPVERGDGGRAEAGERGRAP